MWNIIKDLFSEGDFMPHGGCYLWDHGILWLHITSDALIALAYFSIPFTLVYFVRKRKDLAFNWMFICFAVFIIACGTTHLMEIWSIWHPMYWLSGVVKALTAMSSVPTAILLVYLVPKLLALPSPEQLKRANEELIHSNAELEQFAYVSSHDLKEPLRNVVSFTQLLARRYQGKIDAEADTMIQFIVNGAVRMEELINDLLSYSRIGKSPLNVPVDCNEVLDEVLADLQSVIKSSHAVITHTTLPVLMGNELEWRQLIQNLLSNGMKFHGKETPQIHISAEQKPDPSGKGEPSWTFSVKDNGIGIAREYADRIFVIFQRLHSREDYPGTGIGLAICKKIVERQGGRLWVESELGNGSTFHFTIPCKTAG